MATAFGVFTGIVTLIGFLQSNIPDQPNQYRTKFRIAVGLDRSGGLSNAGGGAPDIRVWSETGEFIGAKYDPGNVGSGQFKDVEVSLNKANQPAYALFTGNDDAVCIAYISQSWADGQKYGWIGNWADQWACNRAWYYSNVWLDNQLLNCAWVDRNGDQPVTGFQVHFPEFKSDSGVGSKEHYCAQNPSLKFYYDFEPNTVSYWIRSKRRRDDSPEELSSATAEALVPPKPGGIARIATRSSYNETRIVRSSNEQHSAVTLCESETSSGPDFISLHEAKFCDMTTREVLPLCGSDDSVLGCFDDAALVVRTGAPSKRSQDKEYSDVLEWGSRPVEAQSVGE